MQLEIDPKACQILAEALEAARLQEAELRQSRERKLWRELDLAASYTALLAGLSKEELAAVRRNCAWHGRRGPKKTALVADLVFVLVERAAQLFAVFDKNQYQLVKSIVANGGFCSRFDLQLEQVEYFRRRGLLFSGSHDGKRILMIPPELAALFVENDSDAYRRLVQRNTAWIALSQGLLYYYGTVSFARLARWLAELTAGPAAEPLELVAVLTGAAEYYRVMRRTDFGMAHQRVLDWRRVQAAQEAHPELAFYAPDRDALSRAGAPGFHEPSLPFLRLVKFLAAQLQEAEEIAAKTVSDWEYAIKNGMAFEVLFALVRQRLALPDPQASRECGNLLRDLYQGTRQWFLKGHTPGEPAAPARDDGQPVSAATEERPRRREAPRLSLAKPEALRLEFGPDRSEESGVAASLPGNYLFKVALAGSVWRKIKLSANHTLHDLHQAIQGAYGFADDHLYAFFMDGKPYSQQRINSPGSERGPYADRALIGQLGLSLGGQFLYLFDFGDEWRFRISLEEIYETEEPLAGPELVAGKGRAPEQYPDYSAD